MAGSKKQPLEILKINHKHILLFIHLCVRLIGCISKFLMPKLDTDFRGVGYVGLGKLLNGDSTARNWSRSHRLVCREYGFAYGAAYRQTIPTGEIALLTW